MLTSLGLVATSVNVRAHGNAKKLAGKPVDPKGYRVVKQHGSTATVVRSLSTGRVMTVPSTTRVFQPQA